MHDRSILGPADVDDDTLAAMVAALLGHRRVDLLHSRAEAVDYDVPSITTVGRYWVSGTARTPGGDTAFRLFVKHVRAWHHSPFFAFVPEEMREMAAASVPWRTEALAYRSDLGQRLPDGLTMPRAVAVHDVEPDGTVIWLEEVAHPPAAWDLDRYRRAAHLLGRLAASARVGELAEVGGFDWSVMAYVHGRLAADVVPRLMDDDTWRQPWVAEAFDDDLRDRLRKAGRHVAEHAQELMSLPRTTAHGDASPNNLLPGPTPDSFVLIDYGFWLPQAVGFDLGQLLAGELQLGRGPWDRLSELDAHCVSAYTRGLAAEGLDVDEEVVRRAHALQLLLFAGLSSLPEEGMPAHQGAARAALARFSLDLVEETQLS